MINIQKTHADLFSIQARMLSDRTFRKLCEANGLPWNPASGYYPRWYNGPAPLDTRVLFFMAEPGAVHPGEENAVAVNHEDFIEGYDLRSPGSCWRANLLEFASHIWPRDTQREMFLRLGGTCSFWMSLPHGSQTDKIPTEVERYFTNHYLGPLVSLFPNAVPVAVGGKSKVRLARAGVDFVDCWAFTKPACNQPRARESWRAAAKEIVRRIG